MTKKTSKLGLVLSGGGARGAYEAGVLHYIRSMLPKETFRHQDFRVISGSSVGAVNASFMAATAHDITYQATHIFELWKSLKQENIYKRDVISFAGFVTRSALAISKSIFSRKRLDSPPANSHLEHFRGLLNTAPFVSFLKQVMPWKQISVNLRSGIIDALSVTATNMTSGKLELFIEKNPSVPYTGRYTHHITKVDFSHVMASAAIPLIFPCVRIGRQYYGDGGLRANTPMSPSIQLGADKILVLGTHHQSECPEEINAIKFLETDRPPSLGLILGKILSSIFIDRLDYDVEQLVRINRIIDWGSGAYGPDFVEKINAYLKEKSISGDIASRGLKKLSVLHLAPSRDLREVFYETADHGALFNKGLTSFEKALLKLLDVDLDSSKDFLSFILFLPKYIQNLLELGFEDAKQSHDKILEFFAT